MINIYEYGSYKEFVRKWVQLRPKKGYGQYRKIAHALGIGTVLISQIFNGDRDLNEEQALELCQFLNLLEGETRYFMLLVRFARAGSKKLQNYVREELRQLREEASELKGRVQSDKALDQQSQSIFYSDWLYSALRLATDIPGLRDVESLSQRFDLPVERVKNMIEFLLRTGLCELSGDQLRMGPKIVFLPAESPYVVARQRSWRIRAFQQMELGNKADLYFTCPLVCSQKTRESLHKRLLQFIEEMLREVKDSPSEELMCLNMDWFKV